MKEEIDVLNYFLNPKMEVMKKQEVEKLLKEYGIEKNQLPKVLESDPVVKALKAKKGDVIKIHRKDPTGEYFYYRVVV